MSLVFDNEHSINLYPEMAKGIAGSPKSPGELIGRPGLQVFETIASPVRGLAALNEHIYAVGNTTFYELSSGGPVSRGLIPGVRPLDYSKLMCSIVTSPTDLLVLDPSVNTNANPYGQQGGSVFISSGGVMTRVVDGSSLAFMDGFFFAVSSVAGDVNKVFVSDLLDGSTWNALNFVQRTGSADAILQLAVLNSQLWMFGRQTTEVWYNAGNPTFPLARIQGATINIGILQRFSLVKFVNTLMWIGADPLGYGGVYLANGLQPVKVSNPGVEYILHNTCAQSNTSAICYGYEEAGHTFYCINLSAANNYNDQQGMTLVYDLTTGLWHERYHLSGATVGQHLPQCACSPQPQAPLPGGIVLVGDYSTGTVYLQSLNYPNDAGASIQYIRQTPTLVSPNNGWTVYPSMEIDADIGSAQMALNYSKDGGRSFPYNLPAIPASNDQGYGSAGGGYGRFIYRQMGRSRSFTAQAVINSSTQFVRLIDAFIDRRMGDEN